MGRRHFLLLSSLFLLTGCVRPSVNKTQADRIKLGQSVGEVEEILGKGKVVEPGEVERVVKSSLEASAGGSDLPRIELDYSELRGIRWGSEKKSIVVVFRNDRVFRIFTEGL